nr:unnamed protein product [Callosobruchus analis]
MWKTKLRSIFCASAQYWKEQGFRPSDSPNWNFLTSKKFHLSPQSPSSGGAGYTEVVYPRATTTALQGADATIVEILLPWGYAPKLSLKLLDSIQKRPVRLIDTAILTAWSFEKGAAASELDLSRKGRGTRRKDLRGGPGAGGTAGGRLRSTASGVGSGEAPLLGGWQRVGGQSGDRRGGPGRDFDRSHENHLGSMTGSYNGTER